MISTLGQILVLLALLTCALGVPVGFLAGARRSLEGLQLTRNDALAVIVNAIREERPKRC